MAVQPHHDLSLGDIVTQLQNTQRGFLNNLESRRRTERIGTWAFMSARLLHAKPKEHVPHLIADDLKSFYHVLCWVTLKHGQHQLSEMEVVNWLETVFNGRALGGSGKTTAICSSKIKRDTQLHSGPTKDLILNLENIFQVRYMDVPPDEDLMRVDAIMRSGKGFPESLFEACIWQIKQEKLEYGCVFHRFATAVKQFRALSAPIVRDARQSQ
ncbi:hypothetical protein L218DRAFT_951904 [Marasmius fiardii PR-910]|nr:hypothetical protein L218DRAFT_951904 [Marasmius fiardii PR-910]